ncbi:hypothetical protein EDB19DRAFT_1827405 [Suillus lakei]|nr:hypothetical protein EDB19DRAFT_1827405 [Suillus lakei]
MPAVHQCVHCSARLQINARTCPKAMELPPNPSTSCGGGKSQGREKSATSSNEECPSGKDKGEIYQVLAKLIFKKDSEHLAAYAEDPKKFDVVEQLDKFNKTGAGIIPLDKNAAANLHRQALLEFLWYDQLHPFLFSNPTCGAKIFTSQPGVNHAADFYVLIHPCGGAGPSMNPNPPGPQLPPPNHQLPSPNPQLPPPDLQLPPLSPHDTGAHISTWPGPTSVVHMPPSTLYPPPSQCPPPHLTGTGGSLIDDSDEDLDDNPHADDNSPFFAPLGNTLDMLDGRDINMYDDNNGMEFDSFRHHVISLDSLPKVVGCKQ